MCLPLLNHRYEIEGLIIWRLSLVRAINKYVRCKMRPEDCLVIHVNDKIAGRIIPCLADNNMFTFSGH